MIPGLSFLYDKRLCHVPGPVRHVLPEAEVLPGGADGRPGDDLEPPVVDVEADVRAVVVELSLHRQG